MAEAIQHARRQQAGRLITALAVCSDDSVGGKKRNCTAHDMAIAKDDLATYVLRDPPAIAELLETLPTEQDSLIVFCTY
ncbi:hypothetical protein [Curtobacterium flaccumfaciens]|uniref:hypothetical protein n=1 Tax=Curtobacterium flaccumfaciens TaxID=2035 RepID=UPI0038799C1D